MTSSTNSSTALEFQFLDAESGDELDEAKEGSLAPKSSCTGASREAICMQEAFCGATFELESPEAVHQESRESHFERDLLPQARSGASTQCAFALCFCYP
jgi:hypothetical protein